MIFRHLLLIIFAAFIWGATFPITALALKNVPPIFFVFLRFCAASLFIFIIPRPNVPWRVLIALGLLLAVGQFSFMFVAMALGVPAGLTSLLIHTQAFFTILIAFFLFNEALKQIHILALILALTGLICLTLTYGQSGLWLGLIFILIAALCGAGGNTILKTLPNANMVGVVTWMSLAAPLPLLVLSIIFEAEGNGANLVENINWVVIAAVIYSAALSTLVAYAIWARMFATYSAYKVAPFLLLVPVFGMSLSALMLGERMSLTQFIGAGLIFIGLAIIAWPDKKQTKSKERNVKAV